MEFKARLTRCPDPFDPERGAEARALFPALAPEMQALIAGAAGCSPYLKSLIEHEKVWLDTALFEAPEAALEAGLAGLIAAPAEDLKPHLRQGKRRIALLVALADLGGVWPLEAVTGALTRLADLAVQRAMLAALAPETKRCRLPGIDDSGALDAGGLVALAMGKGGAHELNYSSDIDLICLFDSDRFKAGDVAQAQSAFVRATRRMTAMLSDLTGDGYVFRTDLRLRPDAAVTPVCLSMNAAEAYYESVGRTWERAAYIKARPAAGDIAAGDRFLKRLTPFVWRRYLDFAAIQDAHDMRLRIRSHKGLGGAFGLAGHNVKLGRGGIREIEFFTQTRQLIAGGRDPYLRVRGTVDGLLRLAEKGWVPDDTARQLIRDYRAHREVEHRLQMIGDAQTHELPGTDKGFARLAAFMGRDVAGLQAEMKARFTRVHELTEGFFAPQVAAPVPDMPDMGKGACGMVEGWPGYPALRSDRSAAIFRRLMPEILVRLQRSARPKEAITHFDAFLTGLPAGVQIFSLFEANPQLIDLIVDIAATAPALARYLGRNAAVLDAVIGGSFFDAWPGRTVLAGALGDELAAIPDYERRLDAARRWCKEWHFRIGVHQLRGLIDAAEAGAQYADLAEAVLTAVWPPVVDEFARRHGAPPGRGATVLGMGSLGAHRLTAMSDLDLIVIYDAGGAEASDGRRPLSARIYYARLTQAFVTAMTAPMAEGRLYRIDMRLRPSGRQGPLATSLAAFRSYQSTEAWTWEHLALTRARPVAGSPDLGREVEAFRQQLLGRVHDDAGTRAALADMRARLAEAGSTPGPLEAKAGAGRLQDIEMISQAVALLAGNPARGVQAQIRAGCTAGLLSADDAHRLTAAYRLMWRVHAAVRLLTGDRLEPGAAGEGGMAFLMREGGAATPEELAQRIKVRAAQAAGIIQTFLDPAR